MKFLSKNSDLSNPLKKNDSLFLKVKSQKKHKFHLGKKSYVLTEGQLKALSAFAIQFGITGAANVIIFRARNHKVVPIPDKMKIPANLNVAFLKNILLLACESKANEIEFLLSQSLIGTFENDVRQRLALASLKAVYKETKSWTRIIQEQGVESKADKHARTGDLIQAYLTNIYDGGEVCAETANIGGFEALKNFKFISHLDIIRDAPEGIQFRLLKDPILFPVNYDSKPVTSYKATELRGIISIVRDSKTKQDELFKNIKKKADTPMKNDDDNTDSSDFNAEESDEGTDEFSEEARKLFSFEITLLKAKSTYLALKDSIYRIQNTKFKKGW